jgi:hypothetical protein
MVEFILPRPARLVLPWRVKTGAIGEWEGSPGESPALSFPHSTALGARHAVIARSAATRQARISMARGQGLPRMLMGLTL